MATDWTKIYKKYKGMWITLADDEQTVLSSALSAKQALAKAEKDGHTSPILAHVPPELTTYVGSTDEIPL